MDALENRYNFNIKITGPIVFNLGCYFLCAGNGVLWFSPHKYSYNVAHIYVNMFGPKPKLNKSSRAPLEHGYCPDLDT